MGNLRVSNEVLYAKTEGTYNTDPTPTTSDAILTRGRVRMTGEGVRMQTRDATRASIGALQDVYGGQLKRIAFDVEIKGSGTAGAAPEIGPLLEACGFEETIVAATSVTYAPESSSHESVTLYYFEGGRKRHILTGCRGTVTFRMEAGGIPVASFEFVGHYTEPTDQSIPSPSYDSTVPRAALGMTFSISGVTAVVCRTWEWAMNNTIAMPPSIAAADGYSEVQITRRDPRGRVTLEAELDSVIDLDALWIAGTRFAWASGALGSAGSIVAVSTPSSSTYITNTTPSEGDGLALRDVELGVDDGVGQPSIAFT